MDLAATIPAIRDFIVIGDKATLTKKFQAAGLPVPEAAPRVLAKLRDAYFENLNLADPQQAAGLQLLVENELAEFATKYRTTGLTAADDRRYEKLWRDLRGVEFDITPDNKLSQYAPDPVSETEQKTLAAIAEIAGRFGSDIELAPPNEQFDYLATMLARHAKYPRSAELFNRLTEQVIGAPVGPDRDLALAAWLGAASHIADQARPHRPSVQAPSLLRARAAEAVKATREQRLQASSNPTAAPLKTGNQDGSLVTTAQLPALLAQHREAITDPNRWIVEKHVQDPDDFSSRKMAGFATLIRGARADRASVGTFITAADVANIENSHTVLLQLVIGRATDEGIKEVDVTVDENCDPVVLKVFRDRRFQPVPHPAGGGSATYRWLAPERLRP